MKNNISHNCYDDCDRMQTLDDYFNWCPTHELICHWEYQNMQLCYQCTKEFELNIEELKEIYEDEE